MWRISNKTKITSNSFEKNKTTRLDVYEENRKLQKKKRVGLTCSQRRVTPEESSSILLSMQTESETCVILTKFVLQHRWVQVQENYWQHKKILSHQICTPMIRPQYIRQIPWYINSTLHIRRNTKYYYCQIPWYINSILHMKPTWHCVMRDPRCALYYH
jgi:hypothetical protein